ncbi:50S ribosomal protein L20 [Candidatus Hodgkinia cicadicola]|uniref:Large ribosomal subunit protein bL20 n=1 Tax=Candidatus Hodgkinia cicadicola TaxID=573658 RepID=A0ABX4MGI1_9HYPH|nr:50S ribosomal subunit protein L20 [Candidatus Hodgkinia cicadicola]
MSKVSRGLTTHYKHKEILKLTKGYYGRRKSCIKTAKQAVDRSLAYKYKSNRLKRRIEKTNSIKCLNKGSNERSIGYKLTIFGLHKLGLEYTLPMLNELASKNLFYDVLFNLFIFLPKIS